MPDPLQVVTQDRAAIYNAVLSEWSEGWQAVFRPSALPVAIDISTQATHEIISGISQKAIRLVSLFFTVAGEVDITLYSGSREISGPMDFGGTSEPRGIMISFPYSPLELGIGEDFKIKLSAAVQVSGTACYFIQ